MAAVDTPPEPEHDETESTPEDIHQLAQQTGAIFDGEHPAVDIARDRVFLALTGD
jgi:hypothetical protein